MKPLLQQLAAAIPIYEHVAEMVGSHGIDSKVVKNGLRLRISSRGNKPSIAHCEHISVDGPVSIRWGIRTPLASDSILAVYVWLIGKSDKAGFGKNSDYLLCVEFRPDNNVWEMFCTKPSEEWWPSFSELTQGFPTNGTMVQITELQALTCVQRMLTELQHVP